MTEKSCTYVIVILSPSSCSLSNARGYTARHPEWTHASATGDLHPTSRLCEERMEYLEKGICGGTPRASGDGDHSHHRGSVRPLPRSGASHIFCRIRCYSQTKENRKPATPIRSTTRSRRQSTRESEATLSNKGGAHCECSKGARRHSEVCTTYRLRGTSTHRRHQRGGTGCITVVRSLSVRARGTVSLWLLPRGCTWSETSRGKSLTLRSKNVTNIFLEALLNQHSNKGNYGLATMDQVRDALEAGASWCGFGWTSDGECVYPMASPETAEDCGGQVGIVPYPSGGEVRGGAICYGPKPTATELEDAGLDANVVFDFQPDRWSLYDLQDEL